MSLKYLYKMIYNFLSVFLLLTSAQRSHCLPDPSNPEASSLGGVFPTDGGGRKDPSTERKLIPGQAVEPSLGAEPLAGEESFWPRATKSMFMKQNISVESLIQVEGDVRSGQLGSAEELDGDDHLMMEPWAESLTKANDTISRLVIELSGDAFLPCRVGHLGDRQVSWIRKRDWFVLTSGDNLYAHSSRFVVLHEEGSQDWILRIKKVEKTDEGYYECQVSTGTGIISFLTHIDVVVPKAQLSGSRQLHINTGSSFYLRCFISKANPGLQHINWLHNGKLLNYDLNAEGISIFTKASNTKLSAELNDSQEQLTNRYVVMSQIDVQDADEAHSGNYTCHAPYVEDDTAYVYVNEGDKTAAVQRIGMNSAPSCQSSAIIVAMIILLSVR